MKSIDEAEAQARLDEILDEAQQQPITIRREGAEIAVVLSMAEYERLRLPWQPSESFSLFATTSPPRRVPPV